MRNYIFELNKPILWHYVYLNHGVHSKKTLCENAVDAAVEKAVQTVRGEKWNVCNDGTHSVPTFYSILAEKSLVQLKMLCYNHFRLTLFKYPTNRFLWLAVCHVFDNVYLDTKIQGQKEKSNASLVGDKI